MFLVSLNTKQVNDFGWYIAAPLLGIPFMLIYILSRLAEYSEDSESISLAQKICMFMFILQKVGSMTGLAAYAVNYVENLSNNILLDEGYFIEMTPLMVIFFIIDVILCITVYLKQRNNEKGFIE